MDVQTRGVWKRLVQDKGMGVGLLVPAVGHKTLCGRMGGARGL